MLLTLSYVRRFGTNSRLDPVCTLKFGKHKDGVVWSSEYLLGMNLKVDSKVIDELYLYYLLILCHRSCDLEVY